MTEFKVHLKLGKPAFVVCGNLDYRVEIMTVGQVRVTRTLPKAKAWADDKLYEEQYMCIETGVGSGNLYEYGKNIFANEADAQAAVIKHQQAAYKERAERDKRRDREKRLVRERDLRTLEELKRKYEAVPVEA